ncbi:MAG: hypothetical protein U1D30_26600 [Planctomycetota bacterium]
MSSVSSLADDNLTSPSVTSQERRFWLQKSARPAEARDPHYVSPAS